MGRKSLKIPLLAELFLISSLFVGIWGFIKRSCLVQLRSFCTRNILNSLFFFLGYDCDEAPTLGVAFKL